MSGINFNDTSTKASTSAGGITGPVTTTDTSVVLWNSTDGTVVKNSNILVSTGDISASPAGTDTSFSTLDRTGLTGSINIYTGIASTNNSGTLGLSTGNSTGAGKHSGSIGIYTGDGASGAASSVIELGTGNINSGSGNSGDLSFYTGAVSSGTRGNLTIDAPLSVFTGSIVPEAAGTRDIGASGNEFAHLYVTKIHVPTTITGGGTTGNQTINKTSGTVNFAATSTAITVSNNTVTANSLVFAVVRTNDATSTIKNVVPGSNTFTITLSAAATAETSVGFFVVN